MLQQERHWLFLFIGLLSAFVVYLVGLPITIMDVDAAQYASMSREMLETGSFLQVTDGGKPYLDKPPLLFWLVALSFEIFGVNTIAFKLPSLIFALLAIYSTYRFARIYYGKEISWIASLMLATTQAFFLITNDTRTDTILTGAVMFAIWHIAAYLQQKSWVNWFFGFVGIALAMLAKGPIGLMIPILGFGFHLIFTAQWRKIFRWEWIAGIMLVLILLLPMVMGLYWQHGWEGVKFYFWTQSFGRITGENEWNNDGGFSFFFVHTFLWAFLPWSLIFLGAFVQDIVYWIRSRFHFGGTEYITWGGFILTIFALSFSRYKLPHYIFPIFPLAAVITARFIYFLWQKRPKGLNSWGIIQMLLNLLLWVVAGLIIAYFFPLFKIWLWVIIAIIFLLSFLSYIFFKDKLLQVLLPSVLTIVGCNLVMNAHFYPHLLEYQGPSKAAFYINEQNIPPQRTYCFNTFAYSFNFYTKSLCDVVSVEEIRQLSQDHPIYIFTDFKGFQQLESANIDSEILWTFTHFHVTNLSMKFLLPQTRHEVTSQRYVIKVY